MKISITKKAHEIIVITPFAHDFPRRAKNLGGKWSGAEKAWIFSARNEGLVREAIQTEYGWIEGEQPTYAIRVHLDKLSSDTGDAADPGCGVIVKRFHRDSRPVLSDGVIVIKGGFAGRGGSMKYPCLEPVAGTILEVQDITKSQAEHCQRFAGEAIEIIPPAEPAPTPEPEPPAAEPAPEPTPTPEPTAEPEPAPEPGNIVLTLTADEAAELRTVLARRRTANLSSLLEQLKGKISQ